MSNFVSLRCPRWGLMWLGFLLLGIGPAPVSATETVPLDPRRAEALWKDARWLAFSAALQSSLQMRCELPPTDATLARELPPAVGTPASAPPGSSDWRSSQHELLLRCNGREGLSALRVRAEFLPMVSEPLALELSVLFRR